MPAERSPEGSLDAATDRLPPAERSRLLLELDRLRDMLPADESVAELALGRYDGIDGLVVLTSSRFLFLAKDKVAERVLQIELAKLSLAAEADDHGQWLRVTDPETEAKVVDLRPGVAESFVHAFRRQKAG